MGTLYDCLLEVHLERYYSSFLTHGISKAESLLKLTPRDYGVFGLNTTEERRRLYELINLLRSVFNPSGHVVAAANSVPRHRNGHNKRLHSPSDSAKRDSFSPAMLPPPSPPPPLLPPQREARSPRSPVLAVPRVPSLATTDIVMSTSQTRHSKNSSCTNQDMNISVSYSDASRSSPQSPIFIEKVNHKSGYNYGIPKSKRKVRTGSPRGVTDEKIRVCVRKRPLSRNDALDVVEVKDGNTVIVNEMKLTVDLTSYILQHKFSFDDAFGEDSSNEEVYRQVARPLVEWIFEKGQATIFAYGQTGAGKTFTMMGSEDTPGLYLLAAKDIFSKIDNETYGSGFHVWLSYYEIYCGQLFDLLNERKRLFAREDGSHKVCIAGLTETQVPDVSSLMQVLDIGSACRSKGSTGANPDSSRSHAMVQLQVRDAFDEYIGRISFIDLAGNERAADVKDSDKQSRKEGAEINQSLLALKECIRSLDQENSFTPFRQSKLTHILKDSFIGKSKTCMIANISPSEIATECTLNTLRYADRVKEIYPDTGSPRVMRRKSADSTSSRKSTHSMTGISPSIFHHSNILCSSTPIRRQCSDYSITESTSRAAETLMFLDPNESPVQGHRIPRKVSSRFNILPDKITVSKCIPVSEISLVPQTADGVPPPADYEFGNPSQEHTPEHQMVNIQNKQSGEDEFLTSDFNYDLNDLNKSGGHERIDVKQRHIVTEAQQSPSTVTLEPKRKSSASPLSTSLQRVIPPVVRTRNHSDPGLMPREMNTSWNSGKMKRQLSSDFVQCCQTEGNSDDSIDSEYWFGSPTKEVQRIEQHQALAVHQSTTTLARAAELKSFFPLPPTLKTKSCDNNKLTSVKREQRSTKDVWDRSLTKTFEPLVNVIHPERGNSPSQLKNSMLTAGQSNSRFHVQSMTAEDKGFQRSSPDERRDDSFGDLFCTTDIVTTTTTTTTNTSIFTFAAMTASTSTAAAATAIPISCAVSHFHGPLSGGANSTRSSLARELDSGARDVDVAYTFPTQTDQETISYLPSMEPKRFFINAENCSSSVIRTHTDSYCPQTNLADIKTENSSSQALDDCKRTSTSHLSEDIQEVYSGDIMAAKQSLFQFLQKISSDHLKEPDSSEYQFSSQESSLEGAVYPPSDGSEFDLSLLPNKLPGNVTRDNAMLPTQIPFADGRPQSGHLSEAANHSVVATAWMPGSRRSPKTGFFPIDPQPVHNIASPMADSSSPKHVVYPVPFLPSGSPAPKAIHRTFQNKDIREHLIQSHEKQLATMTMLCKQEMKLLLQAKSGQKNFSDFIHKVSQILNYKLKVISALQQEILIYGNMAAGVATTSQGDGTILYDVIRDEESK